MWQVNGELKGWPVGTTKRFYFQVLDEDGEAVDITSATATIRLKTDMDDVDGSAVLEKAADVVSRGADGIAVFSISPQDTKDITPAKYWWDIEYVNGSTEYVTLAKQVELKDRVSDVPA